MENKKEMNFNDLLFERGSFRARGKVVAITGESNKVYKSGWTGSSVEITLMVNNTKQKVKIFGGVGKNEFDVKVFQLDGEGKIAKDGEGKAIFSFIKPNDFDPATQTSFDRKEVLEWGDRNEEGKATKIEYISELTSGRFANAILSNKELLIGKTVALTGSVRFKPTQKFDKVEVDMDLSQIVFIKQEGDKVLNDFFLIQTHMIVDKSSLETLEKDNVLRTYIPVYHKYLTPIQKNGKEVKGRNVYVPLALTVNENGFMNQPADQVTMEDRVEIFGNKINVKSQGTPLAILSGMINYKSGMIEREITVEELVGDPVYGKMARQVVDGTRTEESFKIMYKAQNPATVKGEFKQQMDFITIECNKEIGDKIFGISPDSFEIYSLEKIKEEVESKEIQKPKDEVKATVVTPKVNTVKTTEIAPPEINNINDFDFSEEFPFK